MISLKKAISLFLGEWTEPVITDYHLGIFIYRMYSEKEYRGNPVRISESVSGVKKYKTVVFQCVADGILNPNKDFPAKSVFDILGKSKPQAEDIVCSVNPFAFISHLSAMDFHGLTDRNPTILYISSPSSAQWKKFAEERMKRDLRDNVDGYLKSGFPSLRRLSLKKVNKKQIHCYSSSHLGAFKNVMNRCLRAATIGRTFLDMLREPNLCGGIEHILDVYQQFAARYVDLIVDDIDRHGKPIDKVRAGYILEELCGLHHPQIAKWEKFVQRGGSRKLDPSEEYAPVYSKKWCISINTMRAQSGKS